MATTAFARIRDGYPGAHITCGVRPALRPILSGAPYFDSFLSSPKASSAKGLLAQAKALRAERCDLAIVLPNSIETGLVARLARVPRRLGYRQGRPGTMNLGIHVKSSRGWFGLKRQGPRRVPKPMPEYYGDLLDLLQLPPGPTCSELFVSEEERRWATQWYNEQGITPQERVVLFNAGASYGGSKLWLPDRFAALAVRFRAAGFTPIFLAGPAEVEMVTAIAKEADALAAIPVIGLDNLKAVVERACLMVTTDTGPRHYAVALDVPVVCLMGPTDRRYTDFALERQVVIQKELECLPCQRKVCPLGHHDCMRMIEVDEVFDAGMRLLGQAGAAPAAG